MLKTSSSRRCLLLILVGCFFGQTALVYLDDSGRQMPPLSEKAQIGWRVWHKNNCQSCHQIFGYGGFLGPELTNASDRLSDERLESILTLGADPMPAFHLGAEEIAGLKAFFMEIDGMGQGQLQLKATPPASEFLDQAVGTLSQEEPLSPKAELGRAFVASKKCIVCHLPNQQSTKQAPDLCEALERLGDQGLVATIKVGRVPLGMPSFDLSPEEEEGIVFFFRWLQKNSSDLKDAFEQAAQSGDESKLPWFEYSK